MKAQILLGFFSSCLLACGLAQAAGPVVSNVRASQRPGGKLVDIYYDVADADGGRLAISIAVSDNGGATYAVPASSFTGDIGGNITPGPNKRIVWNAGQDWNERFSANLRFKITADDGGVGPPPSGMALIPAGSFEMGDALGDCVLYEPCGYEQPVHTVYVSAFYMDRTEVTKALWDEVYQWAITHGYSFEYGALGKAADHPAQDMTWYDSVKWCNARSQREGRTPSYYTDATLAVVYKSGQIAPYVKWTAGYRLPTESEWEKAARGGLSGKRFPWGNTISHSQANYRSTTNDSYDISPTRGYHPAYQNGDYPYTSPVGSFAPNGYGLYDMTGNVWEWCWDWFGASYYSTSPGTDPRGPSGGSPFRVLRGGSWYGGDAWDCRAAYRVYYIWPDDRHDYIGFRSVLPPGQP